MAKYSSFEDFEVYKATIEFTAKVFELLQRDKFKKEFPLMKPNDRVKFMGFVWKKMNEKRL